MAGPVGRPQIGGMTSFQVFGLSDALCDEVRSTMLSPGYGHRVVRETARGTGPCRACLGLFRVGEEERLLFTYRPTGSPEAPGAPGPVFIHAERCRRYEGSGFPSELTKLPLLIEAHAPGGRIMGTVAVTGPAVTGVVEQLLADREVSFLHVRHGEAGCHVARVDRAGRPKAAPAQ